MVKENRDIEQDKKQILKIGLLTDEVFEKNYQQKCKENDELLWAVIELADDDFNIKNDYINKKEYALIKSPCFYTGRFFIARSVAPCVRASDG